MLAKLESPDFLSDFPLMSALINGSNSDGGGGGGEDEAMKKIAEVVSGCGFESYEALLGR